MKLTDAQQRKIIAALEVGVSRPASFSLAGISRVKMEEILERGEQDSADRKRNRFVRFYRAIGDAELRAQASLARAVHQAGAGRWRSKQKIEINLALPWAVVGEELGVGDFPGADAGLAEINRFVYAVWEEMLKRGIVTASDEPPVIRYEKWQEAKPYVAFKILERLWPDVYGKDAEGSDMAEADPRYM